MPGLAVLGFLASGDVGSVAEHYAGRGVRGDMNGGHRFWLFL